MQTLLVILITVAIALIYRLLSKFFFVKKAHNASSGSLRALAWFFDMKLIHILALIIGVLILIVKRDFSSVLDYVSDILNIHGYGKLRADWFMLECYFLGIYMIYAIIMESISVRGTFGKRFVKIKFDEKVNVFSVILRNILKPLSIVFWPFLIVVSKLSKDRLWLHDRISGTKVVRI